MSERNISLPRQLVYQALALFVLFIVVFPVLWIFSMALDPRDLARPTSLIPPGASLKSFEQAFASPTPNPVTFWELARNSALLGVGVSIFTILVGTTAAYAFSRFRFAGRQVGHALLCHRADDPQHGHPGGALRDAQHRHRARRCATPSPAWASPWWPGRCPLPSGT